MTVAKNLSGRRFGRLTAVSQTGRDKWRNVLWLCQCDCGKKITTISASLQGHRTTSCGCYQRAVNYKHGMSGTREHYTWRGIIDRCNNKKNSQYHLYGGRGIFVCDRWLESFNNFFADMGEKPVGYTIERIDNNGPYAPENCCWATPTQQARNTRQNHFITCNGETLCLREWTLRLGVSISTIHYRLKRGWSPERAVSTPAK